MFASFWCPLAPPRGPNTCEGSSRREEHASRLVEGGGCGERQPSDVGMLGNARLEALTMRRVRDDDVECMLNEAQLPLPHVHGYGLERALLGLLCAVI